MFKNFVLLLSLFIASESFAQIQWDKQRAVGSATLDSSAVFQVNSTTKGSVAHPKMTTTQSNAIATPTEGLGVWDTSSKKQRMYNSTDWVYVVYEDVLQTLTNKTIDADLNTITDIANASIKTGAAIARNKLAAGTPNYVLINDGSGFPTEEQYLDKSRGGSGQNNSSVTFPASGTLVTESGTHTLTNKDIDGGTASNSNRITIPKNTKTNLDALTRKEATVVYDTVGKKFYGDDGTNLVGLGGDIADWVTATAYTAGQFVIESTKIYRCLTSHTSGTFATDLAALKWEEISPTGTSGITAVGTIDSQTKSNDGAVASGSNIYMQTAEATKPGLVSTSAQTLGAGKKTVENIEVSTTTEATKFMGTFPYSSAPSAASNTDKCFMASDIHTMLCSDGTYWNIQGIQPNNLYWEAVTVTTSWTNATVTAKRAYIGSTVIYDFLIDITGTPSSGTLTLTIPDTIDTTALNSTAANVYNKVGDSQLRDEGVQSYDGGSLYYASSTSFSVAYKTGTTSSSDVTVSAPFSFGSTDKIKGRTYPLPVLGRAGFLNTTSVPTNGTTFTAKVSSTGTVSNENVDFINGNCATSGTNNATYTCTFTSSFFSVAPNCTASVQDSGSTKHVQGGVSTSSSVVFYTSATDSGTPTQYAFGITCQMAGVDFTANSFLNSSSKDGLTAPNSTSSAPKTYFIDFTCDNSTTLHNETFTGTPAVANTANNGECTITVPSGNFSNADYITCDFVQITSAYYQQRLVSATTTVLTVAGVDGFAGASVEPWRARVSCTQY